MLLMDGHPNTLTFVDVIEIPSIQWKIVIAIKFTKIFCLVGVTIFRFPIGLMLNTRNSSAF